MKRINEKIKEKANKCKTTNAYKLSKERLEVHKIITQSAITLIALMITIIILLILVGVTLSLTLRRKRNI